MINTAAIAYMRAGNLAQDVIDKLAGHPSLVFELHEEWMGHLGALGLADWRVTPDPVRVASEAALWGAIEAEGLLGQAVIISDDAGQFRVGEHALCWVHAERLVHKLVPANDKQRNAVEVAQRMIWWFYRRLKEYKLAPSAERASLLRSQFDRIFKRRTGYATLDRLLKRLLARKGELLRVLERPEIPLNTNASKNDIPPSSPSAKSPAEPSAKAAARPATPCSASPRLQELKIPFFDYLAARLAFPVPTSPTSQPSSAPPRAEPSARKSAPVTR